MLGASEDGETGEPKGETMMSFLKRFSAIACLALCGAMISHGQTPATEAKGVKVTQITGLNGVKNKVSGRLLVDGQNVRFTHDQVKVEVPTASVEDVVTGADSQRLIHGTLGTLTMFAPYESGRFLSLFRTKLDTLTIKFRDPDGGLHGAIFTMGVGKADVLKKDVLDHGAHSSVPVDEKAGNPPAAKEQKP
jgi:hypothetical protein